MLLLFCFTQQAATANTDWSHTYDDGTTIRISSVAEGILRIKTVPRGAQEQFTTVVRLTFISHCVGVSCKTDLVGCQDLTLPQPHPAPPLNETATTSGWMLTTPELHVRVSASAPLTTVSRPDGTLLSEELRPPIALPQAECGDAHGRGLIAGGCLRATRSVPPSSWLLVGVCMVGFC